MAKCDLCDVNINEWAHRRVPWFEFREGVENGLRPRGAAAALGRALRVESSGWVEMALRNRSDWALCVECAAAFDERSNCADAFRACSSLGYKTHTCTGSTPEDAEAKVRGVMATPPPKRIIKLSWAQPRKDVSTGSGPTLETATRRARDWLPENAVECGEVKVTQVGGTSGDLEITGANENVARAKWESQMSQRATLTELRCLVAPRSAFFGIVTHPGVWSAHFEVPFCVSIPYELPAQVTVMYEELSA